MGGIAKGIGAIYAGGVLAYEAYQEVKGFLGTLRTGRDIAVGVKNDLVTVLNPDNQSATPADRVQVFEAASEDRNMKWKNFRTLLRKAHFLSSTNKELRQVYHHGQTVAAGVDIDEEQLDLLEHDAAGVANFTQFRPIGKQATNFYVPCNVGVQADRILKTFTVPCTITGFHMTHQTYSNDAFSTCTWSLHINHDNHAMPVLAVGAGGSPTDFLRDTLWVGHEKTTTWASDGHAPVRTEVKTSRKILAGDQLVVSMISNDTVQTVFAGMCLWFEKY